MPVIIPALIGVAGQIGGGIMSANSAKWPQNFLSTILGNQQNAYNSNWDILNQIYNPARNASLGMMDYGQGLAFGTADQPGNLYQAGNNISSGIGNLSSQYGNNPILQMLMGQGQGMLGNLNDPMSQLSSMLSSGGSTPANTQFMQQLQQMMGAPNSSSYNLQNGSADLANRFLQGGGVNNFTQNTMDRSGNVLNQYGLDNNLSDAIGSALGITNQTGGWGPQFTQGNNQAFNTANQMGGLLNGGMGMIGGAQGAGNSQFGGMFGQGSGLINNAARNSSSPFTQGQLAFGNNFMGNAQGIATSNPLTQQMSGNAQDLFNRASTNGGYTPEIESQIGRGLDLSYDSGYTPEIEQGLGQASSLFGESGMTPAIAAAMGGGQGLLGDTGYTGSIDSGIATAQQGLADKGYDPKLTDLYNHSMDLYTGKSPGVLMTMPQVMSQARDSAGQASRQQFQAAMRQAQARGGGPGVTLGGGLQNNPLFEFADQMGQNEATTVRNAMNQQQNLMLQQSLQGGSLASDATKTAAQNLSTYGNLYGNMENAAASRHNASVGAGASLLSSAAGASAGLRGAALGAGANLVGNLNATAANRYGSSLNAAQNMMQGGNQTAAQRYSTELGNATNLLTTADTNSAGREMGYLNAGTGLYNQGQQGYGNMFGTNMQTGANVLGTATSGFGNMFNTQNQTGLGLTNAANNFANTGLQGQAAFGGLANQSYNNALGGIGNLEGVGNQRSSIYGNLGLGADQNNIARMGLGSGLYNTSAGILQNQASNQLGASGQYGNLLQNMFQNSLGAGSLYAGMQGQQFGQNNTLYGNQMNTQNAYNQMLQNYIAQQLGLGQAGLGAMNSGLANLGNWGSIFGGLSGSALGNMAGLVGKGTSSNSNSPWAGIISGGANGLASILGSLGKSGGGSNPFGGMGASPVIGEGG